MTDLKQRLAAVLASPKGQAMIEEGQQFSIEELRAAFAQVLAEVDGHERVVLEAAINQGNESRLTRLWLQRAENVQQVLRVPGGALAAALD
jgi:hypothetical protein